MAGNISHRMALPVWRSRLLGGFLLLALVSLIGRAAYLQGINDDFLQRKGENRYSRIREISAHRGMIMDRHGEPLAVSTPVESVCASPQDVQMTLQQLKKLAGLLAMDVAELRKQLGAEGKQRDFVYLKRHLSPEAAARVVELNVPGIFLKREYRRYYPTGMLAAHILGITDVDDNGQEGMELAWQEVLAGKPGSRRIIKDRAGNVVDDIESIRTPKPGGDVVLSLDSKIQYFAHRELSQAVETHKAKAGGIVVMDAQTGEVLALVNMPTYNPNKRVRKSDGEVRNRALTDVFEPGSTLKPFTVAAAIEAGKISPDTVFETSPGVFSIGRATIRDAHKEDALTVAQVIQKSSNIGTAKIALSLLPRTMWEMFRDSGFGSPSGSGFPGEVGGKLRPYTTWRPIEQATMSYGHGISVSLLQLARSYTIFSSEGQLKPVSLLRLDKPAAGRQVISRETALAVSKMLEMVVQPGGTALNAQINGYRVAGKTGTAHKPEGKGYAAKRYISSFVGYAPASSPRLVVAVMIDEPSAGKYFGGAVAAPVFSQVMAGALRILNVPYDAPVSNIVALPGASGSKEDV